MLCPTEPGTSQIIIIKSVALNVSDRIMIVYKVSIGEGEGGMIWENGIETCIISYKTIHQSKFDAGYRMLGAGALG